jgi:hypothetical protein
MHCLIHDDREVPKELLEDHHKVPQAYGGGDEVSNRCWLCPGCHDALHRCALSIYNGKSSKAKGIIDVYLHNRSPGKKKQLFDLAATVAKSRKQYSRSLDIPEAGEEDEDNAIDVTIPIKPWLHHRIKTLATRCKDEDGRKLPMYKYIHKVLERHVQAAITRPGIATEHELAGHDNVLTKQTIKLNRLVDNDGRIQDE